MKNYFLLKDRKISGKHILLAGISKTDTLEILRSKVEKSKEFFKVKVVDFSTPLINKRKEEFANLSDIFDFSAADICDISFIEDGVFDYVVLPAILSSINQRPLKAIQAMFEAIRVLSDDGEIIIQERVSVEHNNRPEYAFFNWYRNRENLLFNLYRNRTKPMKAHFHLDDLKFALKALGLEIKQDEFDYLDGEVISMEEKERLFNDILPFKTPEEEDAFSNVLKIIRAEFVEMKSKKSEFPPHVVLRCSKKKPQD